MSTVVGLLAHVDAGKTTLAEQLLFRAGALRTPGRVDRQNAFLDHDQVERERGITVFSDQASFQLGDRTFHLVDTPGHVDFSGEMERALWVMDCAVLVVSCVEGVQSHTATVWRLLRRHRTPTVFFLNKTDRAGADVGRVLRELRARCNADCVDFTGRFSPEGKCSPELREALAERDEELLSAYLEGDKRQDLWLGTARRLFAAGELFPAVSGAALEGAGVDELLRVLERFAPEAKGDPAAPFSGRVYKVRHDRGGRVVFLKVEQGTLRPRQEFGVPCRGEDAPNREKINELRRVQGGKWTPLEAAGPGDLVAVTGVHGLCPGDLAGAGAQDAAPFVLRPLLSARVLWEDLPVQAVLQALRELEEEEPLLGVQWNESLGELEVRVLGQIQLEVLQDLLLRRYKLPVNFGPCRVLYQETPAAPVVGCGHFEPLRHYAEVHLKLSPEPRGSGVTFDSRCPLDDLAARWQNLVRTHVLERTHRGTRLGAPLTDVRVTLLSGRAHLKHTEGGDFREATYRAVRQGLMQGGTEILEPYYAFEIEAEYGISGRILSDLQQRHGECLPPEDLGDQMRIRGRAPVSELLEYPREFTQLTRGRGTLSLSYDGYELCHNPQEVEAVRGYDPERDVENCPDSVFCSHGAGYPVKWRDAPAHMHLPVERE